MPTILDTIVAHKREEIAGLQAHTGTGPLRAAALSAPPARDFLQAIRQASPIALIAEIKRASPSQGVIRSEFDPVGIARIYEQAGAHALSVLTDQHFFGGCLEDLRRVRAAVSRPILRKDFILDVIQVYEARAAGADAVLLIAECLEDQQLSELHAAILELGMTPLVELYRQEHVERVLRLQPRLIGINNRDLHTFAVDLHHSFRLRRLIPATIPVISESGIATRADVELCAEHGVQGILVGQSLMSAPDLAAAVRHLIG